MRIKFRAEHSYLLQNDSQSSEADPGCRGGTEAAADMSGRWPRHFAMTLLTLSVAPLLQASVCGCFLLLLFFPSSSLPCVHAVRWRWTDAQNGSLYNLLTLWCLFAAIVGRSEWYLRALKSNQMTFFLLFKRARGCVVKGG